MAKCIDYSKGNVRLELDDDEAKFVEQHGNAFGFGPDFATADIFEFGLCKLAETYGGDEGTPDKLPGMDDIQVLFGVKYPKSGPFSDVNATDKLFIDRYLAMSLREALLMITYNKVLKGREDVVEG